MTTPPGGSSRTASPRSPGLRTGLACAAALAQPAGRSGSAAVDRARGAGHTVRGSRSGLRMAVRARRQGVAARRGRRGGARPGGRRRGRRLGRARRTRRAHRAEAERAGDPAQVRRRRDRARPGAPRTTCGARSRAFARSTATGRASVLAERMAAPGVELIVAARADAVVPALVIGLGGIWTEVLSDVAIVPLPASAAESSAAIRSLRGSPLLTGGAGHAAGRTSPRPRGWPNVSARSWSRSRSI